MIQNKKRKRIILAVLVFIMLAAGSCGIYAADYYHADSIAEMAVSNEVSAADTKTDNVRVLQNESEIVFIPENPKRGLIFYPGGKVEEAAYAPLMREAAEQGTFCVLIRMPLRLAVLDVNAAAGVADAYPKITDWYIGGHSLGGSMAAAYAAKHAENLKGLLLLAAYSTEDLSDSGLSVLSVYGSEDGVLNREKYETCRRNLPADMQEVILDGGNHAGFGSYGMQEGDGKAKITQQVQRRLTVEAMGSWWQ